MCAFGSIPSWSLCALLALAACGPACPAIGMRRGDLPADSSAGERRISLEGNVLAQVNGRPAHLRLRVLGIPATGHTFSIRLPSGAPALEVTAEPAADGSYRIDLGNAKSPPLPPGIYRVHVEVPEPLEASFEIRGCTVYL